MEISGKSYQTGSDSTIPEPSLEILKQVPNTAKRGIGVRGLLSGLLSRAKQDTGYRGTSLIENTHPHRITIGP